MKRTKFLRILISFFVLSCVLLGAGCSLFESDEEKGEGYYQSGLKALEEQKTDAAMIHFRNAVQKSPYHARAHYQLGSLYIGSKQAHLAESELKSAIKYNPDLNEAKKTLALLYFQNRAYSLAIPLYNQLIESVGADLETLLMLGTALINTGKVDDAKKVLSEAVTTYPDNPSAKINMARVLLLEKQPGEAQKMMEAAAAINSEDIFTRLSLAQFYEGMRLHDLAESTFLDIKRDFPEKPVSYLALARFYLRNNRLNASETLLKEATGRGLKYPELFQALAVVQHRQKNHSAAIQSFKDAIAISPEDQKSSILLADYYVVLKQYPQAIEAYKKIIEKWPKLLPVKSKIAELLLAERQDDQALKHIEEILKEEPEYAKGHMLRGILFRKEGKVSEARKEFSTARVLDPKSAEGDYYYGLTFLDDQQYDISLSEVLQALEKDPTSLRMRLTLSYIYLKTGKSSLALEELGKILKADPDDDQAMALRAAAHRQSGHYEDAIADYRSILKKNPDLPLIQFEMAGVFRAQGKLDEALSSFGEILETYPDPVRPLREMAKIYVEREQYEKALTLCDDYLKKRPKDLQGSLTKAIVLLSQKKYETADGILSELIAENPESDLPLTMMAASSLAQQNYDAALEMYKRVVQLNPRNFPAYMKMASLYRNRGDIDKAIGSYESLLKVNESYGPAANDLAYLYADTNQNLDRALTLALKAKELIPQNADVADTLGWVYLKSGSPLMAKNQFLEAIRLVAARPVFRYHLGLAYYREKDFPKARESFREAIKLGLGKEESAQVKRMIEEMGTRG
ncbi:MAG: tetratricopeptide repeat protein [Syntrophales bacterium]|nr:tetratricopeptide repeat protein [Syntrophales bacterium]